MHRVDLKEAERRLAELIAEAAGGEEVVIVRGDGAYFRIVPVAGPCPKFGSAKGLVEMSEDFDDPLDDFEVAQCLTEDVPIISKDTAFASYAVRLLWQDGEDDVDVG